jgi:predicted DNA-binding transcriptional regulator AlpA
MQHDTQPVFDDVAREKAGRNRGRGSRPDRPWLKASLRPTDGLEDQKTPGTMAMRPGDSPAGRVGQLSPALASLVANPSSASEVPVDRIPALVAELASEQSALSALQGALTVRLLVSQTDAATRPEPSDRLMTAEEVATALGVTPRWVQRRARRLPFARRISDHAIRYSESGLRRWMSNRKLSAA